MLKKMHGVAVAAAAVVAVNANGVDIRVPQDAATIQGAINAAAAGDRVLVSPGTYYEQVSLSGKDIRLIGIGGAAQTTIDGRGLHTVVLGTGEPPSCEMSGFTIQNGNGDVGGVSISNSALRVHHCTFRSNRGTDLWGAGGMRSAGGASVVEDCVFRDNVGVDQSTASGWYHLGSGTFVLRRCVFFGNDGNEGGNHGDTGGTVAKVNPEFTPVSGLIEDCVFADQRTGDPSPSSWGSIVLHATRGPGVTIRGCRFEAAPAGQDWAVTAGQGSNVLIENCNGCGFVNPLLLSTGATGQVVTSTFGVNCQDCTNDGIPDHGQILRGDFADANGNSVPDCCDQGIPCIVGAPTPRLRLVSSPTVKVNDAFVVNVDVTELASPAVGVQARVGFDPTKVDFVSVAGGSAFPLLIYSASTANTATFATGVQPGSGSGTTVGNVAQLTFRAKTTLCGDAIGAAFATSGFANIVTDSNGQPINFTPDTSVSVTSLAAFSIAGAPTSVSGTACDAGYLGATVASFTGAAPTASNSCGTALAVSVQVTLPDLTTQPSIPARFPKGTSTVVWSASDAAGNTSSVSRTVQVDDRQVLTVAAALDGTSAGDSTRTMSLAYAGGPAGGQSADLPMVNVSGTASGSIDVDITPAITSGPTCASIKDVVHSLRRTAAGFGTSGAKWTVDFGTLKQGDSNNDDLVDIRDFGQFVGDYGAGKLAAARSNYNGDTAVDTADYTFISANFFQVGAACGSAWHDTPRNSISVKELRRMGMGDLAAADINRDGRVDQADIVAFLRGARAGDATRDAGAARGVSE